MEDFTPVSAIAGGVLIGSAATAMLFFKERDFDRNSLKRAK